MHVIKCVTVNSCSGLHLPVLQPNAAGVPLELSPSPPALSPLVNTITEAQFMKQNY